MRKVILTSLLLTCIIFNGLSQEDKNCINTPIKLEKIYCKYCADEGKSNSEIKIEKAQYAYFKFEGKDAVDVMLLAGSSAQRPDYIIHIIIPKESLASGTLKTDIIDEWGNGLDNSNSVIVKFQYRVNNSNSSISQWSNWGGHERGKSEGKLLLKLQKDGTLCGSFNVTVYEDGSSMDKNKKSVISCKGFSATL